MTVKYMTVRDLRNTPGSLWKELRSNATVALTANGEPMALVIGVENEDFAAALLAVSRAKAQLALTRMRREAAERGLDRLPHEEIEAEIRATRATRRR